MPVTITIPAPLRQFAGGQSQIVVEAKTAGEALDLLTSTHSALRRPVKLAKITSGELRLNYEWGKFLFDL